MPKSFFALLIIGRNRSSRPPLRLALEKGNDLELNRSIGNVTFDKVSCANSGVCSLQFFYFNVETAISDAQVST